MAAGLVRLMVAARSFPACARRMGESAGLLGFRYLALSHGREDGLLIRSPFTSSHLVWHLLGRRWCSRDRRQTGPGSGTTVAGIGRTPLDRRTDLDAGLAAAVGPCSVAAYAGPATRRTYRLPLPGPLAGQEHSSG